MVLFSAISRAAGHVQTTIIRAKMYEIRIADVNDVVKSPISVKYYKQLRLFQNGLVTIARIWDLQVRSVRVLPLYQSSEKCN